VVSQARSNREDQRLGANDAESLGFWEVRCGFASLLLFRPGWRDSCFACLAETDTETKELKMKQIRSLSSRILSLFIDEVSAGACDPRTGHCCQSDFLALMRSCAGHCYFSGRCAG
jgi:hypothetical protein